MDKTGRILKRSLRRVAAIDFLMYIQYCAQTFSTHRPMHRVVMSHPIHSLVSPFLIPSPYPLTLQASTLMWVPQAVPSGRGGREASTSQEVKNLIGLLPTPISLTLLDTDPDIDPLWFFRLLGS